MNIFLTALLILAAAFLLLFTYALMRTAKNSDALDERLAAERMTCLQKEYDAGKSQ